MPLVECLEKWLSRADSVGMPSLEGLAKAISEVGENAVVESVRQSKSE